ncbi:MAG: hypothetical protein ABIH92_02895, partial [Nanoarchaeota archaeon]
ETANKFAIETYGNDCTFEEIKFLFDEKEISSIDFARVFENSIRVHRVKLKDNADEKIESLRSKKRYFEEEEHDT